MMVVLSPLCARDGLMDQGTATVLAALIAAFSAIAAALITRNAKHPPQQGQVINQLGQPDFGILKDEQQRRRRARWIAVALVLAALAALFYIVIVIKFGPGVLRGPS
jgi:hypothetical protein